MRAVWLRTLECRPGTGSVGRGTYSTSLDQEGGLLMVMNTQLVKMVIMINMLNSVGGGESRKEGQQLGKGRSPAHPRPPHLSHSGRICVDEHLDSHTPDDAEGAEHIEGRCGREAEDGLALVEHDEGLRRGEAETP